MKLATFVLIGMVDSFDSQFVTVELNMNPAYNAGPAMAVMPVDAFPCDIREGQRFYIVKAEEDKPAEIICRIEDHQE